MKKSFFIVILLTMLLPLMVHAVKFKVYIANINIYANDEHVVLSEEEEDITKSIYKSILRKDREGFLNIRKMSEGQNVKDVKSLIDASEVCELLNIDYLLYGFVEKTNRYYNAEIMLFENSTKTDKKIFYVKSELGGIEDVVEEISDKFIKYIYYILGKSSYHEERKRGFGGIGIYNGAGYWFPIGTWWEAETGLFCIETGFNVIPLTHIYKIRNFNYYLRFGLYISLSLGMNKSGYLNSLLHSMLFKIPVELCFEIFFNHVFIFSCGPQLQLDVLYQEMLFDPPEGHATAAFSLTCGAAYEYWFGKSKIAGIGVNNIFDFTFYENMFYDYKIEIYSIVRIPIGEKSNRKKVIEKNKKNDARIKDDADKSDENEEVTNEEEKSDDEKIGVDDSNNNDDNESNADESDENIDIE